MDICKFTYEYYDLAQNFQCGNYVIDNFLKSNNALDKNQGITYIMLSDGKDFIIGYYNIEVGRVDQIEYIGNEKVVVPMGGSVNINYLALHKDFQHIKIAEVDGQNIYLGDYLLHDCEKRILELSEKVGIAFVTLYSTEQGYHLYHNRNSYEIFEDDMSTFVEERDISAYSLYKCVEDIIE